MTFDAHVKALFRVDRRSMWFIFDLWDYPSLGDNASAMLLRLRDGTTPCDHAWPRSQVDVFARWVDDCMID